MKEVIYDYNFDLERIIKQSKKKSKFKKGIEKSIEANYILDNFAKINLGKKEDIKKENIKEETTIHSITKNDLQNSTVRTTEKSNTKITKTDGTKIRRKKVIKYYIMSKKEELQIIRQTTEYLQINKDKTMSRTTSYLEQSDLIEEGILMDNGELNKEHPLVKKLIPKK